MANDIIENLLNIAPIVSETIRLTPFLTSVDQKDIGIAFKQMRAALYLRKYEHSDAQVIHDAEVVHLVQPAIQSERSGLSPEVAAEAFNNGVAILKGIVELANPSSIDFSIDSKMSRNNLVSGYRQGSAFIMMWMDPNKPELEDVSDSVKRCFSKFDIEAKRADDIQHEDLITSRILDEIKTAEFLLADLTGERPSVYYEVGYAHAIGKRVILTRRKDTKIHFDLAGFNCPEYGNLKDLEKILVTRLRHVTGRIEKDNATGVGSSD